MRKKKKVYEDDDGRTIASMNVDGMPWYAGSAGNRETRNGQDARGELKGAQSRAFTWGVLKAVFLITAVFAVGYFLFVLFCTKIWFT